MNGASPPSNSTASTTERYDSLSVSCSMCWRVSRSSPSGLNTRSASRRRRSARSASLSAGLSAVGVLLRTGRLTNPRVAPERDGCRSGGSPAKRGRLDLLRWDAPGLEQLSQKRGEVSLPRAPRSPSTADSGTLWRLGEDQRRSRMPARVAPLPSLSGRDIAPGAPAACVPARLRSGARRARRTRCRSSPTLVDADRGGGRLAGGLACTPLTSSAPARARAGRRPTRP